MVRIALSVHSGEVAVCGIRQELLLAPKWFLISPVIGAVSGAMAILFYLCVAYSTD